MKRFLALFCVLMLLVPAALAECPQFTLDEYPVVDGSTALLPLSYALVRESTGIDQASAEAYIVHSRTTQSWYNLIYGNADLLLVGKTVPEVFEEAAAQGVELEYKPIGVDGLVFLVNEGNPVENLTHEQILDIYTGKVTNWAELGGDDLPIRAYQRNAGSGSQVIMEAVVMGDTPMAEAPSTLVAQEMGELVEQVSSYHNTTEAIGYSVYFYVTQMYLAQGIRLMPVNGVAPTYESISRGEYPYLQEFYAAIRADEPEGSPARQLYDFLTTDAGREMMAQNNYVACAPEAGEGE